LFTPNRKPVLRYGLCLSEGAHSKIIRYVGNHKKVLDVGCASGYLGKELARRGCRVVGIEIDPEAAKSAAEICEDVIVGDIEISDLHYPLGYFDVIICADILEHLKRPDLTLEKLRLYLRPKGLLIASIPNIAYWRIRLRLLLGEFEYKETGILDQTHLRFLTLKSARKLFKQAGFRLIGLDYIGPPQLVRILPTLLAMQFIIVAEPT
jgi:2-polyprenyl-3-methyl-5-hydroxy-6-metoxy-1,4-benzoquinol methylase